MRSQASLFCDHGNYPNGYSHRDWKSYPGAASLIKNVVVPVIQTILQIVQALCSLAVMGIIKNVIGIITNIIKFTSILKGDWSGAWEAIKGITGNLLELSRALFPEPLEPSSGIWNGCKIPLSDWHRTWDGVCEIMGSLKDFIVKIWDDAVDFLKILIYYK
ncbi:hypothetical protein P7H25_08715 [Paenibacillus larvae]|nr:hypothetical protein [Paenibacillus larvae]MDT2255702.1 hypothetical protein [Paenibacillus larvae]